MQNNSEIFKALASEPRLRIVKYLLEEDDYKCYCELNTIIEKDLSVIYRHFTKLEEAGILKTRKRGKKLEGKIKNPEEIEKMLKIARSVKNES
ncbi:MAG: ArsR/SmtB family transcription factor [Candidatus Hadarchaeia archaeon]